MGRAHKFVIHLFLSLVLVYPALACATDLHQRSPVKSSNTSHHGCHGDAQPNNPEQQEMVCCDQGVLPDLVAAPKIKNKPSFITVVNLIASQLEIKFGRDLDRNNPVYTGPPINLLKILYLPAISPNSPPIHSA